MRYAAIADWAPEKQFPVTFMCAQLGVARQGYYRWLAGGPSERERTDAELSTQISEIHAGLHGHPGVRRVWAELVVRGVRVARKRVWRLMKAAGGAPRRPLGEPGPCRRRFEHTFEYEVGFPVGPVPMGDRIDRRPRDRSGRL